MNNRHLDANRTNYEQLADRIAEKYLAIDPYDPDLAEAVKLLRFMPELSQRLEDITKVAVWFIENPPGTPVPEDIDHIVNTWDFHMRTAGHEEWTLAWEGRRE